MPANPLHRPARFRSRRAGFALLITLTLLAFLVILLVGLATYTRIETAIAGNTQRQAQARQHALLALDVALAQLQKHAGPDQRVTATAESFGGGEGTRHYTGVWDATTTGPEALTWLVSGNETNALAVTPAAPGPRTQELVGVRTSGAAGDVRAPLVEVRAPGVPGQSASAPIGRYAWWVGDQGVKAPVAVADRTSEITYAPYDSAELRSRIRQQMGLGAGPATFEPRDAANATLVDNVTSEAQLAFVKKPDGSSLGAAEVRSNYHIWASNNFSVLSNTRVGGLRRDLSRNPDALGSAFASWANYRSYMEDVTAPATPTPIPPYGTDTVRRRYRMTETAVDGQIEHRVAPILSFFGISFSLRNNTTNNTPTALIASARCVVGLWNPYSAALVPEDLEIVITGLPTVTVQSPGAPPRPVNLQNRFATADGIVKFALPFTASTTQADRASWLAGRVYNWSALSSTGDPGIAGYTTQFYRRDATPSGSGVIRDAGPPIGPNTTSSVQNYRQCIVSAPQTLTLELRAVADGRVLGRFRSPEFEPFETDETRAPGAASSDFAYVFRMPERAEVPSGQIAPWLEAAGRDPRETVFPAVGLEGYIVAGGERPNPALLVTPGQAGFPATYSQLLLDRYTNVDGRNYNEDVPLFELPRAPILSLGALQHLHIVGQRPFSVGNSWGGVVNAWFDQYFFSGLSAAAVWEQTNVSTPNPLLRLHPRKVDGTAIATTDIASTPDIIGAKFLLQGGAFNVNATSTEAWRAMLRSGRYSTDQSFNFAVIDPATGATLADGETLTTVEESSKPNFANAAFARFSHSAQETYLSEHGYLQSDPDAPTYSNNSALFRRGIRAISAEELTSLVTRINALVQQKQATSGPFRSIEEFLSPSSIFTSQAGTSVSLLEKAIEDAGLNTDAALGLTATSMEFSSQFLTQGDIMTALAPVLFPRSDTFVIRTYGESVNPATGATEGRAWCEATVQRVPEYYDSAQPAETLPADLNPTNLTYGRRFKVVSFRWLTRSDI